MPKLASLDKWVKCLCVTASKMGRGQVVGIRGRNTIEREGLHGTPALRWEFAISPPPMHDPRGGTQKWPRGSSGSEPRGGGRRGLSI